MAKIPNPNFTREYLSEREIYDLGLYDEQLKADLERKAQLEQERKKANKEQS